MCACACARKCVRVRVECVLERVQSHAYQPMHMFASQQLLADRRLCVHARVFAECM